MLGFFATGSLDGTIKLSPGFIISKGNLSLNDDKRMPVISTPCSTRYAQFLLDFAEPLLFLGVLFFGVFILYFLMAQYKMHPENTP